MAFSTITASQIQVGKATRQELFQKIKDNEDDLDTRVTSLEAINAKVICFNGIIKNTVTASTISNLWAFIAPQAFQVSEAKIYIETLNGISSGTLEIDIKNFSGDLDPTSAPSVFTTKPSIDFSTASDYEVSSNAAISVSNGAISAGDILVLSISSLPSSGVVPTIGVRVEGEI